MRVSKAKETFLCFFYESQQRRGQVRPGRDTERHVDPHTAVCELTSFQLIIIIAVVDHF